MLRTQIKVDVAYFAKLIFEKVKTGTNTFKLMSKFRVVIVILVFQKQN